MMCFYKKSAWTDAIVLNLVCLLLHIGSVQAACENPRDFSIKDKIVGGRLAHIEDWPGQAVFRYKDSEKADVYFCGGTLIGEDTILTAAHCVVNAERKDDSVYYKGAALEVVLGTQDLKQISPENVRRVRDVLQYKGYVSASQGNDLALIRLDTPWHGAIARLSLLKASDPQPHWIKPLMAAGFGVAKDQGRLNAYGEGTNSPFFAGSDMLLEAPVPFVPHKTCAGTYGTNTIRAEQLCAGYDDGGKDSCQGDSGGPLIAFDRSNCPYQVGIVSWGDGCAKQHAYGVYTRISAYADWITQHVPGISGIAVSEVVVDQRHASAVVTPVYHQLNELLGPAAGRATVTVQGGSTVPAGQQTVFEISSDVSGRLVVIDINAAGQVVQLFPYQTTRRHIEAGQRLSIPDNTSWRLPAGEPYGPGKIVVIVAPEQFRNEPSETGEKGFTPQATLQAQTSSLGYFQNLIQQIRQTLGLDEKGFTPQPTAEALPGWAMGSTDYEIMGPQQSRNEYLSYENALTPGILLEPEERIALPPGVQPRKVHDKGLALTKQSEGFRNRLYNDAAQYCTIGYGHLIRKARCNGTEPPEFLNGITEPTGARLLRTDMERAEKVVQVFANQALSDGQFAALVDFAFNVGGGNLQNSTLLKRVNARQFEKVPYEFRRWTKAGGQTWPGLVARREREIALFFEGTQLAIPKEAPLPGEELDIRAGEPSVQ